MFQAMGVLHLVVFAGSVSFHCLQNLKFGSDKNLCLNHLIILLFILVMALGIAYDNCQINEFSQSVFSTTTIFLFQYVKSDVPSRLINHSSKLVLQL